MTAPYGEVYVVTNKVTGKLYVGQTTQGVAKRWAGHTKRSSERVSLLTRAIAKYGVNAFTIRVVDTADTQEELDTKEIHWIHTLGTISPVGYNLTEGGKGGKMSPEAVEKNRQAHLGKKRTPESVEKFRAVMTGRKLTPEHVEKVRRTHIGRKRSDVARANMSAAAKARGGGTPASINAMRQANLGRVMTLEQRVQHSARLKGIKRSPEACARMKAAKANITEETRERMREAAQARPRRVNTPETKEKMRLSAIEAHRLRREKTSTTSEG